MSRLWTHSSRCFLVRLPATARENLHQRTRHAYKQPPGRRSFSLDGAGFLAQGPYYLLTSLHAAGLPWWAALPASALVIRTIVLRAFILPYRRASMRLMSLQPLIDAQMGVGRRRLIKDASGGTWVTFRMALYLYRFGVRWQIGHDFGAHPGMLRRFGGFVVLMTVSEAIRRMCGAKDGLLRVLLGPLDYYLGSTMRVIRDIPFLGPFQRQKSTDEDIANDAKATTNASSNVQAGSGGAPVTEKEPQVQELDSSKDKPNAISRPDPPTSSWFQPSFVNGGPSWCLDLTKPDNSFILPCVFSLAFGASIYFAPGATPKSSSSEPATPSGESGQDTEGSATRVSKPELTFGQRCMLALATLSIFPALHMPSALLIYFVSNIGISALQTRRLAHKFPARIPPMACKRPVRMNPQRERIIETGTSPSKV